jgi:hypothetical protein
MEKATVRPIIFSLLACAVGTTGAAADDSILGGSGIMAGGYGDENFPKLADLVNNPDVSFRLATETAGGGQSADALAQKLANPIASMISVPFQNNFDFGGGPKGDGVQWKMNIQPVIPFSLNDKWNLITRTIIPVIYQDDIGGIKGKPSGSQSGLGDTVFSAWFSPKAPNSAGWIWGVGPVAYIPTGFDSSNGLGTNQWGAGPTAIALKIQGHFTYGMLINHVWGAGPSSNGIPALSNTFIQPFVSYLPGGGWSFALNAESTYNWRADDDELTLPINLMMNKMFKLGDTNAQWQVGLRYYAAGPDNAPDWGIRLGLTLLFPE